MAAVQLAELKAATQQQVADAFGIGIVTLWRWLDGYRRGGLAGLVAGKRGPRGRQADGGADGKIRELGAAGISQAAIAAAAGVSSSRSAPRWAVSRPGGPLRAPRPPRTARPAGTPPRLGGEAAWAQDELPVLPGPVPRDGERALARFGLLGEGAAPVFTAGARYPLAGLLLALPALAGPGCWQTARERVRQAEGRVLRPGDDAGAAGVPGAGGRALRAEGATRVPLAALGRVLGLDLGRRRSRRAPFDRLPAQ